VKIAAVLLANFYPGGEVYLLNLSLHTAKA